jgi:hypothetical protein
MLFLTVLLASVAAGAQPGEIHPLELDVLADGRLALLDRDRGPVLVDPERRSAFFFLRHLSGFQAVGLATRDEPGRERLYVALLREMSGSNLIRIVAYDLQGKARQEWQFFSSLSLAGLSGDFERNRLLFVEPLKASVYALDLNRKEPTPDLVARVFGAARLSDVVSQGDRLLVADPARGRVMSVQPDGSVRQVAKGIGMPVSLKRVPQTDRVLVLDALDGRVLSLSGDTKTVLGSLSDWEAPAALGVGTGGQVWVADPRRKTLTRFTPAGRVDLELDVTTLIPR